MCWHYNKHSWQLLQVVPLRLAPLIQPVRGTQLGFCACWHLHLFMSRVNALNTRVRKDYPPHTWGYNGLPTQL